MQQNKKLNILFLLQDVPYPISDGMRWKVFHLLKYLSSNHRCDVLAFYHRSPNMSEVKLALPEVNWLGIFPRIEGPRRIWRGGIELLKQRPASLARYYCPKFARRLDEVLRTETYDVLHYDIINMAQYLRSDLPSVHSPNDATSLFYARMSQDDLSLPTWARLRTGAYMLHRYEQHVYPRFTKIHVVSKIDAEYLQNSIPGSDVIFIPFGVDSDKFQIKEDIEDNMAETAEPLILVLGGANTPGVAAGIKEFVECAMPDVLEKFPQAKCRVQGRETDKLLAHTNVRNEDNIYSSVWVDDLDALIRKATLVVLPDKSGTGIKTRALQAFACGATIVGTRVAFEGLRDYVENGEHCVIVEQTADLSSPICELLSDDAKCRKMGKNASILVHNHLSWSHLGPLYEQLYLDAISKHHGQKADSAYIERMHQNERYSSNAFTTGAPKLSVCIPAYNRASLLPILLDSILSQDYPNLEIVIVEDNSPERAEISKVVSDYSLRNTDIFVYKENPENLGYDGNLRRLIELSTGDYIVFMGNDDLMAEGALSYIADAVQRYPNVGVVLRSYASFRSTLDHLEQTFRYFNKESFFPAGKDTITTFFRRCVFISGMVVRRDSANAIATNGFDGTLLYQQYLVGEILAHENGVYLPYILSYHRLGGVPDFGNSPSERNLFVPREQTVESSVHFMQGMLSIARTVENNTGLAVFNPILRDIGNYAYPVLSIQANRSRGEFFKYTRTLAALGFWRVPMFHVYALALFLLRRDLCDRLIASVKSYLGRAPLIGRVYTGLD